MSLKILCLLLSIMDCGPFFSERIILEATTLHPKRVRTRIQQYSTRFVQAWICTSLVKQTMVQSRGRKAGLTLPSKTCYVSARPPTCAPKAISVSRKPTPAPVVL
ncbi:hypothetical protein EDD17DRAFT_1567199, partial [Pisolithus thermaeus]